MSKVRADEFYDRSGGGSPLFPKGARVTGVATATSFSGDGSALTGIAATATVVTNSLVSSGIVSVTNTTDSTSSTTGSLIISGGVGIAKSLFVGNNVTIGGTLTYEDVTNIDSVGLITAQTGVNVSGGNLVVGSGLTVAASTGVATFSGTSDVHLLDNVQLNIGDGSDCIVYHDATHTYITNTTGDLRITDTSGGGIIIGSDSLDLRNSARDEKYFTGTNGGAAEIYFNNTKRIESTNTGAIVTGILTATTAAVIGAGITANNTNIHFNKTLVEKTSIAGGTLGSNNNHSLADGMVYYCTGNESGNLTYNIRQDGSTALNTVMSVGETITTTVILVPNNSGKINTMQIDGVTQTVEEAGGDAFAAGSDGYDVYTFTILRTGTGTTDYLVLGVLTNHT